MNVERHLILQAVVLPPSEEWRPPLPGWVVARISEGLGYWLGGSQVRELKTGDGLVTSGPKNMVLRASQLGTLRVDYYQIQTQLLNGMLTVTEGNKLEQAAHGLAGQSFYFSANEALGQKFSRLVQQAQPESLPSRAALFQFWSQIVAGVLSGPPAGDHDQNKLHQRFRQLVTQLSDAELTQLSLSQMAGLLACSERHFSRLFRQEFGISLRARQSELRLLRAQQLLANPGEKISRIAFQSGYRHLSLFNSMFKKRFGLTPREWRRISATVPDNSQPTNRNPDSRLYL